MNIYIVVILQYCHIDIHTGAIAMPDSNSDSGPAAKSPGHQSSHGVSRRTVLIGMAAMIAEVGLLAGSASSHAQPATKAESDAGASAARTSAFLTLSHALTGHDSLSPLTASRMYTAMQGADPGFTAHVDSLAGMIQAHPQPKALLDAAAADPALHATALSIVAAWYTGTVGKGAGAVVVSYAEALMYWPVSDAQPVATYCPNGPLWWTAQPPSPDALPAIPPSAS
jgi:fructose 5-dehydrogenase small subunit